MVEKRKRRRNLRGKMWLMGCSEIQSIIFFQEEDDSGSGVEALNLVNVGGIFLVLLIGLILGLIMASFEKSWNSCAKKRKFT